MSDTFEAIRRGIKAGVDAMQDTQAHRFQAAGKPIVCSHCGHDSFQRTGLAGLTQSGFGIKCCQCSHIEFFGKQPDQIE